MIRVATVALLALSSVACREGSPVAREVAADQPRVVIRLTTGPRGGGFYPLGEQVAAALRLRMPDVEFRTIDSLGAISNIEAIQQGRADIGFTFADVAYMGFNGLLTSQSQAYDRLRGVAVLQLIPISLVVRPDLGITGLSGLLGRRISVGPTGSGTALTAGLILHEFNLDPPRVQVESIGFQESATRLLAGTLDAMFDNAIIPDSVRRATASGAQLIPIVGPPVERLRRDYPFLKPTLIPAGTYPRSDTGVHTIGVDGLLICDRNLDDILVYELTKEFFNILSAADESDPLRLMDLEQSPATPIPLHNGAARYYRERELAR